MTVTEIFLTVGDEVEKEKEKVASIVAMASGVSSVMSGDLPSKTLTRSLMPLGRSTDENR